MNDKKPVNLGAHRAQKQQDGTAWTPVECLRQLLDDIESGKLQVDRVVAVYQGPRDGEVHRATGFYNATPEPAVAVGMLGVASQMLIVGDGEEVFT